MIKEMIESAMAMRLGMSEASKETLTAFNAKQEDWRATCRKCGAQLMGSLSKLKEHRCGPES